MALLGVEICSSSNSMLGPKEPAWKHGFDAANDKLIRVFGAEISYKSVEKMKTQTKLSNLSAFLMIYHPPRIYKSFRFEDETLMGKYATLRLMFSGIAIKQTSWG